MVFLVAFLIILAALIWLLVEYAQASNLNGFLDEKIMRRFLWLWLPVYALWRLLREFVFTKKK